MFNLLRYIVPMVVDIAPLLHIFNVRQSIILLTENLNYFDNIYEVDILKNVIYNMAIKFWNIQAKR